MLWHEGRTCQQYDDSPEGEIIRTTKQRVKEMSKPCPGKNGRCGARIMKEGGCDMVGKFRSFRRLVKEKCGVLG